MLFELHLSDCATTETGFRDLAKVRSENALLPALDPRNANYRFPLYIRLERNFIAASAIQEAVGLGVITTMRKSDGIRHTITHKARLLLRENGKFVQMTGEPYVSA